MKMLYLGKVDMQNLSSGVTLKVQHQQYIFERNGYKIDNFLYKSDSIGKKINNRLPLFFDIYSLSILKYINKNKYYDVVYYRRFPITRQMLSIFKIIKKNNPQVIILVEIPTFPYDNEITSLNGKLLLLIDKINRKKLYKYTNRILTYSKHEYIYSIKTITLANGLIMDQILPSTHYNLNTETINAIAVAKMEIWQGYDRIIKGLYEYYSNNNIAPKRNIVLHLVGEGNEINRYKNMVEEFNLLNNVKFYGKLFGNELDSIYDICSIAVSSLAKHRIHVYYDSVLKDKEYAAKGLPIISAVRTEFDEYSDFKYYKYFESNDNPIDINEFLIFYDDIYKEDKMLVTKKIREFAESKFDMSIVLNPIFNYINEIRGSNNHD